MSAETVQPALPLTTPGIGREMPPGTNSRVDRVRGGTDPTRARGEDEAFRELVRPYEHAVFMATQGILRNEADAEDAAQEAVLKAFINLAKFRGDSKFSTWLIRIATNEALMKLRKQRRQKLHDSLDEQRMARKAIIFPATSLTGARFPPRRCRKRSCGKHYPERWPH